MIKKTLQGFILLGMCLLVYYAIVKNTRKHDSLEAHAKYSVVEIISIEMGGKSWSNCGFYLNGEYTDTYTRIIVDSERDQFMNKKFLVKYDSTNIKSSKLLLEVKIPDTLRFVPNNGWKELPEWAKE